MAHQNATTAPPHPCSSTWPSPLAMAPPHVPVVPAPALQRSYQIPGYNDFAEVRLDMEDESIASLLAATPLQLAQRCKSSDLVFPQKIHMLLTASERDPELQSIVSWKVHGRAFAVHDRKRFLKEVLPEWFLQSRFESFQRQLNLYGFKRITTGPDRGACYHELFLRQKPLLATRIQRIRLKGKGPRKPAKPENEPNFYRMTLLPTHEMVAKRQTCNTMYYAASVAPPVAQDTSPITPQLSSTAFTTNPTTRSSLALPGPPLPHLMPKPASGMAQAVRANPNGLCAMMLRPVTRNVETAQAVAPPQDVVVPYKAISYMYNTTAPPPPAPPSNTSRMVHPQGAATTLAMYQPYTSAVTAAQAAVISHPPSPVTSPAAPAAQCVPFPMIHNPLRAPPATTRRVSSVCSTGSPKPLPAAATQLQLAPQANNAPAAQQPVPRCVSQNTLEGTSGGQPIQANDPVAAARAAFLAETTEQTMVAPAASSYKEGAEETQGGGDDDDFAHILFELANS